MASYDEPEFFLDKKWRLTKTHNQDYNTLDQQVSCFTKSSSVRIPHRNPSSPPTSFRRSSSTRHHPAAHDKSSPALIRSFSKKGSAFTRKCTAFAKEQKARLYIIKRCVSMLVRLRKHPDDIA